MKTINESPTEDMTLLTSIDSASLDDVTGGCSACGQACANGQAPAAADASKLPAQFAAFSAVARR